MKTTINLSLLIAGTILSSGQVQPNDDPPPAPSLCLESNVSLTELTLVTPENATETIVYESPDLSTWSAIDTVTGANITETYNISLSEQKLFYKATSTFAEIKDLGNVWCIGDSWTDCYEDLTWRRKLSQDLESAEWEFDFVGSKISPTSCETGQVFDRDHDGTSGITANQILNSIPTLLDTVYPDTVLLLLGGNDIFEEIRPDVISIGAILVILNTDYQPIVDEIVQDIGLTIDAIRAENPNAVFHLGSYGDINVNEPLLPALQSLSEDVNAMLAEGIEDLALTKSTTTSPIHYVDHNIGWDRAIHVLGPQEIHPTNAGMEKVAENWLSSITTHQSP